MGAKKEGLGAGREEEEDEDNVPIALSRGKLAKRRELQHRKSRDEDDDDDDGDFPIPFRSIESKERPGSQNGRGSFRLKKEGDEEEVDEKPRRRFETNVKKNVGPKSSPVSARVKKEQPTGEVSSEDEDDGKDSKKKIKRGTVKTKVEQNSKIVKKVSKVKTVEDGKKKPKNVYDFPGRGTSRRGDPLRIFYETLYQQLPSSEMAQFWMMEYGLLPPEAAHKIYEKKLRKNHHSKQSSPVKVPPSEQTVDSAKKAKHVSAGKTASRTAVKRKVDDASSDDDDFISSRKKPKKQKLAG
ncbi:unnamed protein product [Spirodela intermedia]|uniref:Uncharacterized protein n=1 Tax=Spirodela intermedia TaxID=51605 RepID=A0A7I8IZ01_SPIIN|nr:unnamed protein product [Spirodela intermedia]CAA6663194.1 unnamed protein product [Spirodela intermedia]